MVYRDKVVYIEELASARDKAVPKTHALLSGCP